MYAAIYLDKIFEMQLSDNAAAINTSLKQSVKSHVCTTAYCRTVAGFLRPFAIFEGERGQPIHTYVVYTEYTWLNTLCR